MWCRCHANAMRMPCTRHAYVDATHTCTCACHAHAPDQRLEQRVELGVGLRRQLARARIDLGETGHVLDLHQHILAVNVVPPEELLRLHGRSVRIRLKGVRHHPPRDARLPGLSRAQETHLVHVGWPERARVPWDRVAARLHGDYGLLRITIVRRLGSRHAAIDANTDSDRAG